MSRAPHRAPSMLQTTGRCIPPAATPFQAIRAVSTVYFKVHVHWETGPFQSSLGELPHGQIRRHGLVIKVSVRSGGSL